MKECVIEGCNKMGNNRGLCKGHYDKLRNSGTLEFFALPSERPKKPLPIEKQCKSCKQTKPINQFSVSLNTIDGIEYTNVKTSCNSCRAKILAPANKQRRDNFLGLVAWHERNSNKTSRRYLC